MQDQTMKFRISSALKDIIGKELITDQYIAIFELVKNSFDAYARNVQIVFENIGENNARILIIDDGKGMDYDDLVNKWLFVAYSAKREGTEDKEVSGDYRGQIQGKRVFAGAKGVGRFSCDRLGSQLILTSVKKTINPQIESLTINWEEFEKDSMKEFVDITVNHNTLNYNKFNLKHGTVLEISGLRDEWDRSSLLKLKSSLEKLINPNQGNGDIPFSIEIIAKDQLEEDKKERERIIEKGKRKALKEAEIFSIENIKWEIESNQVNGIVKNSIFETLGIKSTMISSYISKDGKFIETEVKDRGVLIYKIKEENHFSISNIKIILFFLNPAAKNNFTRLMGIQPVKYGSVFMYKNGFRIYPYGEPGEDVFGIDRRKAQGHSRFIGTREILGRVEIYGDNNDFKESTSRDGGFIKSKGYTVLQEFFISTLRRLEKYVVDVAIWGSISITDELSEGVNISPADTKEQIKKYISSLANSKEILELEFDEDFFTIIEEKQKDSINTSLQGIRDQAIKTNNPDLAKKTEVFQKEYSQILTQKNLLELESIEKNRMLQQTNEELTQKTKQNLFLKSVTSLDHDNIISLHHQIGIYATDVDAQLLMWIRKLNKGYEMTSAETKSLLSNISMLNSKILSISKFATKANFNLQSELIDADLFVFIEEYIANIYTSFASDPISVSFINVEQKEFIMRFKPIELTIILDNILNNSRKARARKIEIIAEVKGDKAIICFKDDGVGLNKSIKIPESVFEKGYTTTSGSGLGLFHVKHIVEELGGNAWINDKTDAGFEICLEVKK